ncbi:3-deoxy-7-phosphoheptulonate synthase [Saccharopolyspora erythraea]|uniref:3-deoxy-7-phosphoheptulonate synthase n=1 Tax=Saccharopolyspora erythraea TaxID=1836 RepID=UPI002011C54D|nr:3-deoxy-7-phosphoheptulonate synthase [Saccharopolyspora erythraea]
MGADRGGRGRVVHGKNGTGGSLRVAVDAVLAAAAPHAFAAVGEQGSVDLVRSSGNPDVHVVLRGGADGPNHGPESVARLSALLGAAELPSRVVIDAKQVAADIGARVAAGETAIRGVMLESFLVAGRQDVVAGRCPTYGQSITDACMSWDDTAETLRLLASSVRARRRARALADWLSPAPVPV